MISFRYGASFASSLNIEKIFLHKKDDVSFNSKSEAYNTRLLGKTYPNIRCQVATIRLHSAP